jgi:transcriptional regulator with XRE-family HTH domain
MKEKGYTFQYFSKITKINVGTLSALVNGNRSLAMGQLEKITAGMGLPPDTFYDAYIEDFFLLSPPNWRRLKPFLYRCAELNRIDCIERVIALTMDTLAYIPQLFKMAEDFFQLNYYAAAKILFRVIAESEKHQHSERLALCHYRLFLLSIGEDYAENVRAAALFEYFIDNLNEEIELDAIKDLAMTYLKLRDWDRLDHIAEKLIIKAQAYYNYTYHSSKKNAFIVRTKQPLCLYILYGYHLRALVCKQLKNYEMALHYTNLYTNLEWVGDTSKEAQEWIIYYKERAIADTFQYQLMLGNVEILPSYISYISNRETEIVPALASMVQAAKQYQFEIEPILHRFQCYLSSIDVEYMIHKKEVSLNEAYISFFIELASFHIGDGRYIEGMKCILDALTLAIRFHQAEEIIKCVTIYEKHRHMTSQTEQQRYQQLISAVYSHQHEEKAVVSV